MTAPHVPPDQERLYGFAVQMALEYIPKLGIPPEHLDTALKAYVAGFFAGSGAAHAEAGGKGMN